MGSLCQYGDVGVSGECAAHSSTLSIYDNDFWPAPLPGVTVWQPVVSPPCSFTKFCHTRLISTPSACRVHRACHWKSSSMSPEDVQTRAFSIKLQPCVSVSSCGSVILLSFPVCEAKGKWLLFVCFGFDQLPLPQSYRLQYFNRYSVFSNGTFQLSPVAPKHVIYEGFLTQNSAKCPALLQQKKRSPIWLWWARKSRAPELGEGWLHNDQMALLARKV